MHSLNNYNKTANYQEGTSWNGESWPTPAPQGDTTTWNYDAATGLLTSKVYADGHGPSYAYTTSGRLATRTWARKDVQNNDLVTTYSYNLFGELTGIDYSDSTPDITYAYNRFGKLSQVTDVVGTRTFAYNAALDEVSETITGLYGKTLTRAYTSTGFKGKRQGLFIDNISNYTYGYDTYGRMNQITIPSGSFSYTRLANSDLVSQMTRPNGITTTWSYEQNHDLVTQVQNGSISTYGYTSDAIGRRTSLSRSGSAYSNPDTISYTYNDRSELTGAQSNVDTTYSYSYAYDPIGNRITASEAGLPWTYTTNNLNQYTSATENNVQLSFSYDLDGSMTYRPMDANSGWTQIWNGENRMVETYKGNDRLTFKYDYMGRRVEKCVFSNNTLTSKTLFVYDGFKCVEELDGLDGSTVTMRHTWQPFDMSLDVILATATSSSTSYFLLDANKNVMQKTDVNGIIRENYAYAPFGESIDVVSANVGFSSEFMDTQTALVYYNYRYYLPGFGRWNNYEPKPSIQIQNVYSSVGNNPLSFFDHLGNESFSIPIGRWGGIDIGIGLPNNDYEEEAWNREKEREQQDDSLCCENGRPVSKVPIWVCKRGLNAGFLKNYIWGPISHSFISCEDPKDPKSEESFGKYPHKEISDDFWGNIIGPGYIRKENG